jgi:hypothetical protein
MMNIQFCTFFSVYYTFQYETVCAGVVFLERVANLNENMNSA